MAQEITQKWKHNARTTLSHYAHKLLHKERQFNFRHYLPLYFEEMIGDKVDVKIADLGAGLFCTIGSLWDTAKVTVYPSDILADDFAVLLKEHDIVPVLPVEKQDMEQLSSPDAFFDIVHCVNALDHCTDPVEALHEMYRVCKPGGWIYLRHYPHVGLHQNYCGLHTWNLELHSENDCRIWNKDTGFLLSGLIPGFVTKLGREYSYEPKDMIISMYQKLL